MDLKSHFVSKGDVMELWDLYDRDGNKTGETWERRHSNFQEIPEGRYHIVSDILVRHVDGAFRGDRD